MRLPIKNNGDNLNGHEVVAAVKKSNNGLLLPEGRSGGNDEGRPFFLETTAPETNVKLVSIIGCKYNSQNVLCFIMTKDAGLTAVLGHDPYIAKFPNKFGNIKEQNVDHPEVILSYFEDSSQCR
jgi:hypothetical protein